MRWTSAKHSAISRTTKAGTTLFDELIAKIRFEVDHGKARQARSRITRNRILEVAHGIFSKSGYDGASTRDIAEAAGVNQGLVTYYFGSKRELWRAAVDKALAAYRNSFADRMAELDDPSDRDFYRYALRHYVQWASENVDVLRILFSSNRASQTEAIWYSERHHRPFFEVWTMLLRHGQEQGIVRPGSVIHIYYLLVSSAAVFATPQDVELLSGLDVYAPAFVKEHADLLFEMLILPESKPK